MFSPAEGEIIALDQVEDELFSKKMLGDGFAVIPSDGNFYAPCSGTITLFHKANHAFGITTEDGLEVLVHVGLDTVELGGEGFTPILSEGQKVQAGDLILKTNLKLLEDRGLKTVTPVTIVNFQDYSISDINYKADFKTPVLQYEKIG
ncbi:PTS glucose transporter subunit IIA [Citroniella saccharovorans]|uniref:PTS glucose transporter subunit IIA n=1 Tax=Citroniella saccharovorans TaxID=2053367 RepID=A0AAW9MYL6_9FIRM|nr:PTS glucose transporter subunit IIA [Citroniella saccharovorans]MEB3429132.1 PTS glucose transporter subunit IIA [Citroniella saccharovorans]